jgi:3-isopropylmalate/(R)-2-methylmalate dehydratase small subunit
VRGKVWKFGNNVDTDAITPSKYLGGPQAELKEHILEVVNPRFPKEVKAGDIIVAGSNFGCGSSRESAPAALKALGIGAIVAESFARIFFRNAIAIGLPIITSPDVSTSFGDGDEMELDLTNAKITNVTQRKILHAQPLPEQMLKVLSKGGIVPLLKEIARKAK